MCALTWAVRECNFQVPAAKLLCARMEFGMPTGWFIGESNIKRVLRVNWNIRAMSTGCVCSRLHYTLILTLTQSLAYITCTYSCGEHKHSNRVCV